MKFTVTRLIFKRRNQATVKARQIICTLIPVLAVSTLCGIALSVELPAIASPQSENAPSPRLMSQARSALSRGNAKEAIQILSTHLQAEPNDVSARVLLGQAFSLAGQDDRAMQEFETVLQTEPENFVALAALGEIYEQAGRSDKAEPLLARAARASHGSAQIKLEWAVVLARLHRYAEAQSALSTVPPPAGPDERIEFFRLRASTALGLGNAPAAAADMEKALALKPADTGLAIATAIAELQSKNSKRAAVLAQPLFERTRDPQAGVILLEAQLGMHTEFQHTQDALRSASLNATDELTLREHLAEMFVAHDNYEAAVKELQRAAELDAGRADLQFNLALAQFRSGSTADALASAEKCKQLGDSAEVEDLLGDIQEARGDNLAAVQSYQSAVALSPKEERYRLSLAVELIRHNNFDAAEAVLKQTEELEPKSWRVQLARGMVAHLAGTDEDAARYLTQAVEDAPEPEAALKYLGQVQLEQASPPAPAAIANLCGYANREPGDGHLQFYCGALLFRRDYATGNKANADEILRRLGAATRALPNDAASHCQLGKAYRWLEQWKEALSEAETCARLDPDSADAHYRLAQIYRHFGQTESWQREMRLYESASKRVEDENARRDATMKTFLYTIQKETPDHK